MPRPVEETLRHTAGQRRVRCPKCGRTSYRLRRQRGLPVTDASECVMCAAERHAAQSGLPVTESHPSYLISAFREWASMAEGTSTP